uniref:Reverse transcriptase domain-containing protein n=1 Tax=Sparus aurata TaxID=8175 RepID=A0A671XHU9_SPAAU
YKRQFRRGQINDMYTDWFETPFGVKQGDILSPTLFALFVNDLALQIKKNNLESESDLQNMLNLVSSWCHKWRLVINKSKTQIMHFRNKGMERSKQTFYFDSASTSTSVKHESKNNWNAKASSSTEYTESSAEPPSNQPHFSKFT